MARKQKVTLHEPGPVRTILKVRVFSASENAENSQSARVFPAPGVRVDRTLVPGNWKLEPNQFLGSQRRVWHVTHLRDGTRLPKGGLFVKEPQPRGTRDNWHESPVSFDSRSAARNAWWEARLLIGLRKAMRGTRVRVEKPAGFVHHQYGQGRVVTYGFEGLTPVPATRINTARVWKIRARASKKGFELKDLHYTETRDAQAVFKNILQDRAGKWHLIDGGNWNLNGAHPEFESFKKHALRVGQWPSGEMSW
jgi:hypothetical protein